MRFILNFLWFIFGGFFMGLTWWFFSLLAFVSIIGIPWGRACFVIGKFTFFPFGYEAINRDVLEQNDIGTSSFGLVGNVIWFIFAGFFLALGHVICMIASAVSIIGIPFAFAHYKLAVISIAPIGKMIVEKEVAQGLKFKTIMSNLKKEKPFL